MTTSSTDRNPEIDIPLENSIIQEDKDVEVGTIGEIQEEEVEDVVPNGGYGWVNVGCVILQNSATWGMSSCCCLSCRVEWLINRCEYHIWSILGILPPEQSLRRRLNIRICLGWRIMRSHSSTHRSGGESHGSKVWLQGTFDHWYVSAWGEWNWTDE